MLIGSFLSLILNFSQFSYGEEDTTKKESQQTPQHPNKIIPIGKTITEMVVALGLKQNIVNIEQERMPQKEETFLSGMDIIQNIDKVRSIQPNIILTTDKRIGRKITKKLRGTDIVVVIFPAVKNNNDLLELFKDVSIALKAEKRGFPIIWDLQDRVSHEKRVQNMTFQPSKEITTLPFAQMVSESKIIISPLPYQTIYPSIYRPSNITTLSNP